MKHKYIFLFCINILLNVFCYIDDDKIEINKKSQLIEMNIPFPSGIVIDKVYLNDDGEDSLRIGRLQYNSIKLRPEWKDIHLIDDIFSIEESNNIIKESELYALKNGWSKNRHIDYKVRPTQDLPLQQVYSNNQIELDNIYSIVKRRLFPMFSLAYGINVNDLKISDLFITKYDAKKFQKLDAHKDKSPFSFVIALNDNFEGGGTYFVETKEMWKGSPGSALIFNGHQLHGGSVITSGIRYILAGFCDHGQDDNYDSFMKLYNPIYDGYAASSNFHTGDIIKSLEICEIKSNNNYNNKANDHSNDINNDGNIINSNLINRRLVDIDVDITDELWLVYAQSCEKLAPYSNSRMIIERWM